MVLPMVSGRYRDCGCGSLLPRNIRKFSIDGSELVMPRREAKKYLSEIEVTTEESKKTYQISVNHPASIGSWKIYQSGYDNARGRWSTTSTLECVKDSWYIPVHLAMWMILIAGIMMFILGWKEQRKEEKK